MSDAAWLVLASIAVFLGNAWLALAMDTHWQRVARREIGPTAHHKRALRVLGVIAMAASLALCLQADHISMASLVWLMLFTATATTLALLLAWCPRALVPFIALTIPIRN